MHRIEGSAKKVANKTDMPIINSGRVKVLYEGLCMESQLHDGKLGWIKLFI